ncbi:MAG: tetratricopeptide repeat protein [bacterium]|nr:tetratricopeptide repeat protein [bacterium]
MKIKLEKLKLYMLYMFAFTVILALFLVGGQQSLRAQSGNDKEIFNRAKLALFDGKWDRALEELNRLTDKFPDSSYYSKALFYKGRCWKEKKGTKKALEFYNAFLGVSTNESLIEEALIATINLNFELYKNGQKEYLKKIIQFLKSKQETVRYYAAFKLSYAKDRRIASQAVPVLKQIVNGEIDPGLVDRAKIRLMSIDPKHLKELAKPKSLENSMLFIRVIEKNTQAEKFMFSFPFSLARLALEAIPAKERKMLEGKGFNLDKLLKTITKTMKLMKFESDDTIVEIGIK